MGDSAEASRPSSPTAETSVSGLSDDFMEAVRAYARSRDEKLRVIYEEAISQLVKKINSGKKVFFPAAVAGRSAGKPQKTRHIRLSSEVKDAMIAACEEQRVHRSVFFHLAVRDYLSSKDIDAPD